METSAMVQGARANGCTFGHFSCVASIQVISDQRKQEIIVAFQATFKRDNSAEIEGFPLSEIRDADAMLGDRDLNAGYRIAMRNRIAELERDESRSHESKIRAWNLITGILIGLVIYGLGQVLFG